MRNEREHDELSGNHEHCRFERPPAVPFVRFNFSATPGIIVARGSFVAESKRPERNEERRRRVEAKGVQQRMMRNE